MHDIRQVIKSNSLNGIINLPEIFLNKDVEITVTLIDESVVPVLKKSDITSMLIGSVTELLIGVVPNTGKSLEDYRYERLSKYESVNLKCHRKVQRIQPSCPPIC